MKELKTKFKLNLLKVRALVRAENLETRSNCGYNVLTGETRKGIQVPEKLLNQFQEKAQVFKEATSLKSPSKK
jgi:hypothetical protein